MPLRAVVQAFLRLQPGLRTSSGSSSSAFHPLRDLLLPFLLTPRTTFQKYHDRMNQMIEDDSTAGDDEGQMMWLAYRNAKGDEEFEAQTQDVNGTVSMYDAEEAWKERWLTSMEQREVQIQIILHFLLLYLPGPPASPATNPELEFPVYLSSSKKRKRKQKEATPPPSAPELEECVELFMDKLSMWQLMSALDAQDAERQWERSAGAKGKGKGKDEDERDWMQVFCEDVIEPRFKAQLPDLCKLLRSKVFQDSSFTDDPGSPLSTPPASPRPAPKRLKSTASSAQTQHPSTSRIQSYTQDIPPDPHELQRARSRSLSLSLEQERARSLSISAGTRKRAIVREVSMTTAFKGKAQAKAREKEKAAAKTAARKAKAPPADPNVAKAKRTTKGVTLVAATPVKRNERGGTSQAGFDAVRGGQPLPRCERESVIEGDEDDGHWTLSSSLDVLLLGSEPKSRPAEMVFADAVDEDGDEDVLGWMGKNTHLAVMDTPTKPKHTRR